ncbi:MAG: hypothetical protein JST04_07585 [Bdellovibrionales bacterium]|nr:hypothetical protein [Bdellovibrionales bacterium]
MSISIVWLDENLAKIYDFSEFRMERRLLRLGGAPEENDANLGRQVASATQILVLSPGAAGARFADSLRRADPSRAARVVGCETLAEAEDQAVAEYAFRYFRKPIRRVL